MQDRDFDVSAELAGLTAGRADIGGIGCFIGTVRDGAGGRRITAMTLEHYPGMTERAMAAIGAEAEARWQLLGCTLVHRVGRLLPGENIVLVAGGGGASAGGAGRDGVPDRLAEDAGAVLEEGRIRRRDRGVGGCAGGRYRGGGAVGDGGYFLSRVTIRQAPTISAAPVHTAGDGTSPNSKNPSSAA